MGEERTTLYLRGVPRDLVREVKAEAARRGCTLAAFVTEALERRIRSSEPAGAAGDGLEESMRWYQARRARLVRKYAGEYIAIVDRNVIDHDESFEALAERVFAVRSDRAVFMPLVTAEDREVRVRSPRRVM